jgi:signal transduction histidine kinase
VRAQIKTVAHDGLVLTARNSDGEEQVLWLPSSEWSDDHNAWNQDREALEPGIKLDVVLTSVTNADRPVASARLVSAEDLLVSGDFEPRFMRVTSITRLWIRGRIQSADAAVSREDYQTYLDGMDLDDALTDHGALGEGDWVGGTPRQLCNVQPGVPHMVLSVSEYLDSDPGSPSAGDSEVPAGPPTPLPTTRVVRRSLPEAVAAACSPLLLVDNSSRVTNAWGAFLNRQGIEVQVAHNADQAWHLLKAYGTPERRFRMAIIDANLDDGDQDLGGMPLAIELSTRSDCRVVIMSAEEERKRKLTEWGHLRVSGYAEKPLSTEDVLNLLEQASHSSPRPLDTIISDDPRPVDGPPSPMAPSQASPVATVQGLVRELATANPGVIVHLFRLHPRSGRARSVAHYGEGLNWEPFRGKIHKSPIRDASVASVPIVENVPAPLEPGRTRHTWTLEMLDYQSFCGIPVEVPGAHRHALVAFHRDSDAFDLQFQCRAQICAERIGRLLECDRLRLRRSNEASLVATGMTFATLAHELNNDMFAILPLAEMVRDTLVGTEALTAGDKATITTYSVNFAEGVNEAAAKAQILRGLHGQPTKVSVLHSLRRASEATRRVLKDLVHQHDRIQIATVPPGTEPNDCYVKAVPAALIMIFFNIYLNAAQQIALAWPTRRFARIWHTLDERTDAAGGRWVYVRLHDTGPGIHPDDWSRIFLPGVSTKPNGSGLGLFICRQLLEQIRDGQRRANVFVSRSIIWDGATFTVKLPLVS